MKWANVGYRLLLGAACSMGGCTQPTPDHLQLSESSVRGVDIPEQFQQHDGHWVSQPLPGPRRARVAVMLDLEPSYGLDAPRLSARSHNGAWVPLAVAWQRGSGVVLRATITSTNDTGDIQLRLPLGAAASVRHLHWSVTREPDASAAVLTTPTRTSQELAEDLLAAGVLPRESWGARGGRCATVDENKIRMAVHHTATGGALDGSYEARLQQIQSFHLDGRGWCDVGYHFFVTDDGRVWEGRPLQRLGAHVSGSNTGNVGVAFIGCFQSGACDDDPGVTELTTEALGAGGGLLGQLARRFDIEPGDDTIKGHRDHADASTSCPGDALHAELEVLRESARGAEGPGPVGLVKGVLWDLSTAGGPSEEGAVRIHDAQIQCSCDTATHPEGDDGVWVLEALPGSYLIQVQAPGFEAAEKWVDVQAAQTVWASMGLAPVADGHPVITSKGPLDRIRLWGDASEAPPGDGDAPMESGGCGAVASGWAVLLAGLVFSRKRRKIAESG